ncbi:uncharacterized protein UHOD_11103 [Ustilago sp. UG-2017b]|nr:uncharacterized protein UHOD_11103 [Ustilago sp. UG-2017b]
MRGPSWTLRRALEMLWLDLAGLVDEKGMVCGCITATASHPFYHRAHSRAFPDPL